MQLFTMHRPRKHLLSNGERQVYGHADGKPLQITIHWSMEIGKIGWAEGFKSFHCSIKNGQLHKDVCVDAAVENGQIGLMKAFKDSFTLSRHIYHRTNNLRALILLARWYGEGIFHKSYRRLWEDSIREVSSEKSSEDLRIVTFIVRHADLTRRTTKSILDNVLSMRNTKMFKLIYKLMRIDGFEDEYAWIWRVLHSPSPKLANWIFARSGDKNSLIKQFGRDVQNVNTHPESYWLIKKWLRKLPKK